MIVFRHNEHEVDAAEAMAKAMGFVGFRTYPSDRFNGRRAFPYTHDGEEFVLEPAAGSHPPRAPGAREIASRERRHHRGGDRMPGACARPRPSSTSRAISLPCCHIGRQLYLRDQGAPERNPALIGDVFDSFDMRRLNVDAVGFDGGAGGLRRIPRASRAPLGGAAAGHLQGDLRQAASCPDIGAPEDASSRNRVDGAGLVGLGRDRRDGGRTSSGEIGATRPCPVGSTSYPDVRLRQRAVDPKCRTLTLCPSERSAIRLPGRRRRPCQACDRREPGRPRSRGRRSAPGVPRAAASRGRASAPP